MEINAENVLLSFVHNKIAASYSTVQHMTIYHKSLRLGKKKKKKSPIRLTTFSLKNTKKMHCDNVNISMKSV